MSGNGSGSRRPNICFILTDQGRRTEARAWFDRLLAAEAEAFNDEPSSRPAGAPPWAEG